MPQGRRGAGQAAAASFRVFAFSAGSKLDKAPARYSCSGIKGFALKQAGFSGGA
jgi:hypothetical protein